ncbi:MAG: hypothetical protein KatS3mg050_4973 [Litorilinea sp.]|nr:MAG: hypothetical protein KatS3mg050_4973 [Litorilinea sp.]
MWLHNRFSFWFNGPGSTLSGDVSAGALRLTLLLLALLLAACGAPAAGQGSAPAPAQEAQLSVADLPAGIGRGFPLASAEGVDNRQTGLNTGDLAPNFRMEWADGGVLELHSLQGHPVMLNFWATWCGPCRLEMPEIVRQAQAHPELVVLAINVQEKEEAVRRFAEEFEMEMPVARDESGSVRTLYQLRGMPTSIFIDREGRIAATWAGLLTPDHLDELLARILSS